MIDLVAVETAQVVAAIDPVAVATGPESYLIDLVAVVIGPEVVAIDPVAAVTGRAVRAMAIDRADPVTMIDPAALDRVAAASNGVPATVGPVGIMAETIPAADQIATTGIAGAAIVASTCRTIGTIIGTIISTIATIGTTTIGGIDIPIGRGATQTILITGVWRLGLWRRVGLIMGGPNRSPTTTATTSTIKAIRCTTVRNPLPQRPSTRTKPKRSLPAFQKRRRPKKTGCRWASSR